MIYIIYSFSIICALTFICYDNEDKVVEFPPVVKFNLDLTEQNISRCIYARISYRYYTTISSLEQRRRYKAEFNADYEEYRRLHAQVAKVSKRFIQLQDRLRREEASGNWDEYEVAYRM